MEVFSNKFMAGHSHWAGIKHKKGRQDKQRANLFAKLSREISVAAKLGSSDPSSNHRLRAAIQLAKSSNMPKDNIQRAIKRSESGNYENFENLRYEAFGPFGAAFIIETLTNNKNRTASNLRTIFSKKNGRLGENGSTSHLFHNCGVFIVKKDNEIENLINLVADMGGEDIKDTNKKYEIITKKEDFQKFKNIFEEKKIKLEHGEIEWKAKNIIKTDSNSREILYNLVEQLEENDDIQKVFFNFEI